MKKERFVAFFDAVMAIIMTIAVLEFAVPGGAEWNDMKELSSQILVYAVSFFWLALMWINIHNLWYYVETISRGVIIINIILLFFASMIPFFVIYISKYFLEPLPQSLYGIDVIFITICNQVSLEMLKKDNPQLSKAVKTLRQTITIDLIIKIVGIIIGITVYPPAVMISVMIALIILGFNFMMIKKKNQ